MVWITCNKMCMCLYAGVLYCDYVALVLDCADSIHYGDVIMGAIVSKITSLAIVYSTVYSGADQRKHQSSALLAFVLGVHRGPVNSPHKWPVTRKMFPFDDVIMCDRPVAVFTETLSQSPCTVLKAGKLPAFRVVQGDCFWPLQNGENSLRSRGPVIYYKLPRIEWLFQSILRSANRPDHEAVGGHVLYPTDSLIASKLGLCGSLHVDMCFFFLFVSKLNV